MSKELAQWGKRYLINRTDVFGQYLGLEARDKGAKNFTAKRQLDEQRLLNHFSPASKWDVIGLHAIAPDNTCKWCAHDIDAHTDAADPRKNLNDAIRLVNYYQQLGYTVMLLDSNGRGGYHVIVLFDKAYPSQDVHALANRARVECGLPEASEVYPKQDHVDPDAPYGNWLRLLGPHHTSDHWTRLGVVEGTDVAWMDWAEAVEFIPNEIEPTETPVPAYVPPPVLLAADEPAEPGDRIPAAELREMLQQIPNTTDTSWDDYFRMMAAVHSWDNGDDGKRMFNEWSRKSPKHEPGYLESSGCWDRLRAGKANKITVGTIFKQYEKILCDDIDAAFRNCGGDFTDHQPITVANVVWMSDIEERTITWLWKDRIPLGCLTLIAGTGGVNKSTVCYDLAARLSVGKPFPLGGEAHRGKTIIVSGEDDPQTIIRPRLRVAGADLKEIGILDIREIVKGERRKKRFTLTDLSGLEQALTGAQGVKMVVIDPVGSFGGKANGDKQFDVMQITSALNDLAAKHNIAIVVCQHLNKSSAGGNRGLRDRLMGSAGWYDGSRSCFLVTLDKSEGDRRTLSHGKANHSKLQDAVGFQVVVTDEGANKIISLQWDTGTSEGTADDHLMDAGQQGENVEDWLRSQLEGGDVLSTTLKAEAAKAGIHEQKLWRASEKLKVKKRKEGMTGGWRWSLPTDTLAPEVESDRPF